MNPERSLSVVKKPFIYYRNLADKVTLISQVFLLYKDIVFLPQHKKVFTSSVVKCSYHIS